jgi:hypothetical protein
MYKLQLLSLRNIILGLEAWQGVARAVKHLLGKHEALSLNPGTVKIKTI